MATLEQAAEYQRHLKKMSYKEQVEQENRMKQLRDIQRRKYLEEHPRETPKKKGFWGF